MLKKINKTDATEHEMGREMGDAQAHLARIHAQISAMHFSACPSGSQCTWW